MSANLCPVGSILTFSLLLDPAVYLASALFRCTNKIHSLQVCSVVFLGTIKEILQMRIVNTNQVKFISIY